jgi:hypothetical protein
MQNTRTFFIKTNIFLCGNDRNLISMNGYPWQTICVNKLIVVAKI